MKEKNVRLYNLIFPIWMLVYFPHFFLFTLPANFLIDLLVVRLMLRHLSCTNRKAIAKSCIWKVWLSGFAADFIGGFLMFSANLVSQSNRWWIEHIANPVMYNPFETIPALLWVICCTFITALMIFLFNIKWALKKADLSNKQKKQLALSLSFCTAPYLFFLPTIWFVH